MRINIYIVKERILILYLILFLFSCKDKISTKYEKVEDLRFAGYSFRVDKVTKYYKKTGIVTHEYLDTSILDLCEICLEECGEDDYDDIRSRR